MSDDHWLDQPSPAAARAADLETAAQTLPPLGVVAQRIADVSPRWADVTVAADAAPASTIDAGARDRTIGVEAIREGWLLHRAASRVAEDASPDLGLLIGDWCYAAGLCEITDHGSLDDVATLARLVGDVSARAEESIDALDAYWHTATTELHHA